MVENVRTLAVSIISDYKVSDFFVIFINFVGGRVFIKRYAGPPDLSSCLTHMTIRFSRSEEHTSELQSQR